MPNLYSVTFRDETDPDNPGPVVIAYIRENTADCAQLYVEWRLGHDVERTLIVTKVELEETDAELVARHTNPRPSDLWGTPVPEPVSAA